MNRVFYSMMIVLLASGHASGQVPTITSKAWITNGRNFDVDVANGRIYLVSDHYYELGLDGNITYTNNNIDDTGQGSLDFGPAIDVGPDGVVHVINRNGGNAGNGFNLNYSKREVSGTWSVENNRVGDPVARNYVVDVVAMDGGEAVYAHSRLTTTDVAGSVYFYGLNGTSVDSWGDFGSSSYYRVDADFRMERYQNILHVATSRPDPWGYTYYMKGGIGSSLPGDLASSATVLKQGTGRKGMPDVTIDQSGNVYISHGDTRVVDFDKYASGGSHTITNREVLSNLGFWHLELGLSAMASSPSGDTLLVIGLETDGSETAASCAIQYTYSFDGGATWSSQAEIPDYRTHGGEGRSRPRVHYYGYKFYIFYYNVDGGIALSTLQFGEGPQPPPPPPPPTAELVDPVDLSLAQLTSGKNFDVEVANDRIYIISDHYYEYNLAGEKYAEKSSVDDTGQDGFDFGPALAVGSGGEVHVITRNGGNATDGFNLKYSRKQSDGSWDVEESNAGSAMARNYVVDVVPLDGGGALYAHGSFQEGDGFGKLHFYNLNGTGVTSLGDLGRNDLYKVNSDFRMERYQNTLHLASGKPFDEGTVYYMEGDIGGSLITDLTTSITSLEAGSGMSGQPDLRIDNSGNVFLTYGSDGTVLFNRYSNDGSADIADTPVFDKLGAWKLNLGLSAIASSPDGDTLLAVGLKTDGSVSATSCTLYYSWSKDGGMNWIYPEEIPGFTTNAGEGRIRPRIRHYMGRFYIFFNNVNGGISVKTIKVHELSATTATTPVILPAADSVTSSENITITSPGSGAIYYSFTDATPDMLSTPYTGPFTIDGDRTIHAVAYRSGYLPSEVVSVSKKLKGDPPPPPPPPPVLVDPVDLSLLKLSNGKNFDVEVANDRIYLISDHYYEFNLAGTTIEENVTLVDSAQGIFDFGPALSVGSAGEVHVITRNSGSGSNGYNLKYSTKQTGSTWSLTNKQVGIPLPRNYVVDVVALDGGGALYAHSVQTTTDVYGSVFFYTLNGSTVAQLGGLGRDDLYRVDSDFRMERIQDQLHMATGKPDEQGVVYYMDAPIGTTLPATLAATPQALVAGTGRRGQPDLRTDESGNVFITYGASGSVIFQKYSGDGSADIKDKPIFSGLGTWHLNLGLSAIASTPDGDTLLAVGLRTDDTKEASNSRLFYSYSLDGGDNWVYPIEISGFRTNAGEGRMRPRIKFYRGRFYLFFNNVNGGIAVKTLDLRGVSPQRAVAPVILPAKDTVMTYEGITIESTGSDAIHYSFTEAVPGLLSTRYVGPFTIDKQTTIHAVAYRSGYLPSEVVSVVKKVDATPPLVDPEDLTVEKLAGGTNFDVEMANHKIYLISDHYYEFDLAGELLNENKLVTDKGQGTFDFSPALAVGNDGSVHVITRGEGNGTSGFNLHYSKREQNGLWSVESHQVGSQVARNYVVDMVALEGGKALYAHSKQTTSDVWGSIFFYNLNGTGVESLGGLGRDDLYRIDSDFRMERIQEQLHLATGRPDPDGAAHYMHAAINATLPVDLATSQVALSGGEGRRGQPDLRTDMSGNVLITYGSAQSVIFDRYSNDGSGDIKDNPIFSQLGTWHLELGLSALACSPNGDTLMAVGLRTDGSKEASNCALLFTYSFDGGGSWVYPNEIFGYMTNGGEGRLRPKVKFYQGRFYIFYNNVTGGIAVTSVDLRNLVLLKTTAPVILPGSDSVFTYEAISLQATNSDAIFYSFSDAVPGILSTLYGGPFTIDTERTIHARAYRSGYLPSDVVSVTKKVIVTSTHWKEASNGSSLELYPVPASSVLTVRWVSDDTGELSFSVYDHSGRMVHLEQLQKSSREVRTEIEIDNWPAGVYLVVMTDRTARVTKRFVVK